MLLLINWKGVMRVLRVILCKLKKYFCNKEQSNNEDYGFAKWLQELLNDELL